MLPAQTDAVRLSPPQSSFFTPLQCLFVLSLSSSLSLRFLLWVIEGTIRKFPLPAVLSEHISSWWGCWSVTLQQFSSLLVTIFRAGLINMYYGALVIISGSRTIYVGFSQQWSYMAQRNKIQALDGRIIHNACQSDLLNSLFDLIVLILSWDLLTVRKIHNITSLIL